MPNPAAYRLALAASEYASDSPHGGQDWISLAAATERTEVTMH
jgi:hypothetical protein